MERQELFTDEAVITLACGCYTEIVNGKHINFLCDRHEEEYQDMLTTPIMFKKTKMREGREL